MPDPAVLDAESLEFSERLTDEDIESREFLLGLANGNRKMAKLIDLRFRTQDRRAQTRHWQGVQRMDVVEGALLTLATDLAWLRWVPRLVLGALSLAAPVVAVAGLLRLVGVV